MTGMAMIDELARNFAAANSEGTKIPLATLETKGLVPDSFEQSMDAQRAFVTATGKSVGGWKLAIRPDGTAIAAPMIDCYNVTDDNLATFPARGIEGLEVEICVTLASDIPASGDTPLTRDEILRYVDKVYLGAELLGYRLVEKNQVPFPLFLADRLANQGFVIGPEIDATVIDNFARESAPFSQLTITEGTTTLFDAKVKHPNIDPLAPLVAFANAPLNKGGMLNRGQVITTGSLCGAIPTALTALTAIDLASVGSFVLKTKH